MRYRPDIPIVLVALLAAAWPARAVDTEGCLTCHQYRGLARIDPSGTKILDFSVDPAYFTRGLGPHARLKCTDCHVRAEVEVFPHKPRSTVNCLKTCHIDAPAQVEVRFSHERVAKMLAASAHKPDSLRKANTLLGSPVSEQQAQCLLCHDEPMFRKTQSWLAEEESVHRCNTCHDADLPKDTKFAFWHVYARSVQARTSRDVVKVCGSCHSNPAIQQEFKLSDAAASYLFSFHGKAVMLGSQTAANCIHCHVGMGQNVHMMLSKKDPTSPTSPGRVSDTCRTADCHRDAGAQISSAAIHLNIATTRGIELLIAVIFVGMILFTFGPSLMITALELLHYVLGKHDPDHHHNEDLAKQLMANDRARKKLVRFSVHQRLQHWVLAASFATLCLTGFPIKFADRPWAAWLIERYGGLTVARTTHRVAGVVLIAGFVYHLSYVIYLIVQSKKRTGKGWIKTIMYAPMCVSPADGKHMLHLTLYLLFLRRTKPSAGHFSAEEKFEYFGVFWGTFVLGTTGMLMWFNDWTSRHLTGSTLTISMLLHTFEAFLAMLHVGIVHMATVIFSPVVFPVSPAMITGDTPLEELAEGHSAMLKDVAAELSLDGGKEAGHV
ncbi:MAG: formate dehydrogenase subunit gamma [Tepidisphaerales bacterium]